jgi:hypothetical protein
MWDCRSVSVRCVKASEFVKARVGAYARPAISMRGQSEWKSFAPAAYHMKAPLTKCRRAITYWVGTHRSANCPPTKGVTMHARYSKL